MAMPKSVISLYSKSKKFQEGTCMRLASNKQNIEVDASLHQPLPLIWDEINLKLYKDSIILTVEKL